MKNACDGEEGRCESHLRLRETSFIPPDEFPRGVVEVVSTHPSPFAILNIFVLRMLETPVIMRSCRLWGIHVHILASRILDYFAKQNSTSLRKIVDFAIGVPPNRGPIKEGKKHQKTFEGCLYLT